MEPDDLIIAVGDEIDKDRHALPNDLFGACQRLLESRGLTVVDPAKCMVLERREKPPTEEGMYLVNGPPYSIWMVTGSLASIACDWDYAKKLDKDYQCFLLSLLTEAR